MNPSVTPALLVLTQAQLPTNQFPHVEEGTGTGCSVCDDYDPATGLITLVFAPDPVPPKFVPVIVADGVRYAPSPAALAALVATNRAAWKLPAKAYPAFVVLDVGFEKAGKMVSDQRILEAASSFADAAE
jgi:hypothetical protein